MKNIAILGSTGSIGRSTLEVIRQFPDRFKVAAISAGSDIDCLYEQVKEFHPEMVCVNDAGAGLVLKSRLNSSPKVLVGKEGLGELIQNASIDKVVLAISGSSALPALLDSIENKKDIALANKEALVMAGPLIMREAQKQQVKIIPIDSEQSAIWQCLDGQDRGKLKNIYLTASGGPFRRAVKRELKGVSVKKVLRHPRWSMGKKISVDSATLMNKGLEILEAMFLFNVRQEKIKILIHPEAIIHSMVEFIDGVILAQLSATDMRIPIQYALSYPDRLPSNVAAVDFFKLKRFTFGKPDFRRFPCLELAYSAARQLGTSPCVLNAANEICVDAFLKNKLEFISIPKIIAKVLGKHRNVQEPDLREILEADAWARQVALGIIGRLN